VLQYGMFKEKKTLRRKNERKTSCVDRPSSRTVHHIWGRNSYRESDYSAKLMGERVQRSRADQKMRNSPSLFHAREDIFH
jgi:hypothetical protein